MAPITFLRNMVDAQRECRGSRFDIEVAVHGGRSDWHLDPASAPGFFSYDLFSVLVHELGHAFGFLTSASVTQVKKKKKKKKKKKEKEGEREKEKKKKKFL